MERPAGQNVHKESPGNGVIQRIKGDMEKRKLGREKMRAPRNTRCAISVKGTVAVSVARLKIGPIASKSVVPGWDGVR